MNFQEPPTKYRKKVGYDWAYITAELRAHPMKWWLLGTAMRYSTIVAIANGKTKAIHPDDGYETTTADVQRDATPRLCDGFVRYNPHKDKALTQKEADKIVAAAKRQEKENT